MRIKRAPVVHMLKERAGPVITTTCGIVDKNVTWASWHDRVTCFDCKIGPVLP